jgi:hypothetical protein
MRNDSARGLAEGLLPLLRQYPRGAYGIALGGAHAKMTGDAHSDLDLYLFAGEVLPNEERTAAVGRFSDQVRDIVSWDTGAPFDQAGTDFTFGEVRVECWLRHSGRIETAIRECRQGVVRREWVTWTTTGFYNHCCLADLQAMVVLDDPAGLLDGWKEQVREYPPALRRSILSQHLAAARFWPDNFHYASAVERQDLVYCTGIVQQVVHNLIQVLFALNRTYFPGDKKLVDAVGRLPRRPGQLEARLTGLIFPGRRPDRDVLREQRQLLQTLLADVEALVAAAPD